MSTSIAEGTWARADFKFKCAAEAASTLVSSATAASRAPPWAPVDSDSEAGGRETRSDPGTTSIYRGPGGSRAGTYGPSRLKARMQVRLGFRV